MLEDLREQLNGIDGALLKLIAKRQALVSDIGAAKRESGRPTRDFAQEKRVLELAKVRADELGVPPELAERVLRTLIEASLARQEQDSLASSDRGAHRRALVLGGCGKMGHWFAGFLASQGFEVEIADPAERPTPFRRREDWPERVDEYDVVVVAAPIKATVALLRQLLELKPPGLIFDLASLKSPLRQPLRALADAGCRVTSLHPMFGPDTRLLSGRHVIFVDVGNAKARAAAVALFADTMAAKVEMSLEDHDRLVAYVLGLSHALNIAFFTALRESGEASDRLAELSSTTFDNQLAVARSVAGENPHLYFEIQSLNDYRLAPLNALSDALVRLKDLIERNDEPGFVRLMQLGHRYLSERTG